MDAFLSRSQRDLKDAIATSVCSGKGAQEVRRTVMEYCAKRGYNPVEALLDLADELHGTNDKNLVRAQVDIHKELLKFTIPQMRAVDIQGEITADINIRVTKFSEDDCPSLRAKPIEATETPVPTQTRQLPTENTAVKDIVAKVLANG